MDVYLAALDVSRKGHEMSIFQTIPRGGISSGRTLLANNLKMAVDGYARQAGIPHITVDQIRRLGLHLYIREHGLEQAQRVAGHAHLKTTVQFLPKS